VFLSNTDTDEESGTGMSKNSVRLVTDEDTIMNKLPKLKDRDQTTSIRRSYETVTSCSATVDYT